MVIHTIHGRLANRREMMVARKHHAKLAKITFIRTTMERSKSILNITFTDQDTKKLDMPYDDASVVELSITNCFMKKVLIDNGSSVDLILLFTLKQMRFNDGEIKKIKTNLVRSNDESSQVIGRVVIHVTTNGVIVFSTMMVINSQSTYNVILGRPWLREIKAVPSTYHQMLKFPSGDKIDFLREAQKAAWNCYIETMRGKPYGDK